MTDTSNTSKAAGSKAAGSTRFELRPVPAELGERYLAEGLWDDRTLGQLLSDALYEDPTRRFRIWSPTNPYLGTVGEVYEEALRVAAGLRAHGFGPGDVVAFQLPNWFEAAVTFYACTIVGVTIVPIVIFYGPKEVGFILRQSGARAFVVVSAYGKRDFLAELATIRDGLDDLETVFVVGDTGGAPDLVPFDTLRDAAEPMDGPVAVDPDSPAVIGYTSGTTADPKGVVHTHRTLGCEVRQLSGHQAEPRPRLARRGAGRPRHRHAGWAALPARRRQADLHDRRVGPADGARRHGRGGHLRRQRLDLLLHQPPRLRRTSGPSTSS